MELDEEAGVLRYNEWVSLKGIPREAFSWRPGGYHVLRWLVDYLQVKTKVPQGKGEAIVWDPNGLLREKGDPYYLVDHIRRAVHVAVGTVEIHEAMREAVEAVLPAPEDED